MKVGTDAILLGAWATAPQPQKILDIGTGTGVVALMLAQRFPEAVIDAVEIEPSACEQANHNSQDSPWADRINIHGSRIQQFQPAKTYDLIVCNPPYFQSSLKPPVAARRMARHDDSLSPADLLYAVDRLLTDGGRFSVIEPSSQTTAFVDIAADGHLHCIRRCNVRPTPQHNPKRVLLEFSRSADMETEETEMAVESARHVYTPEYSALAKDFLLKL